MARTKNTTRKAPNRPQRATRPFVCNVCSREFGQSTNYYRHLGLVHRITKDGQPIDAQTYAKYAQYSKRGKRIPSELKTTEYSWTSEERRQKVNVIRGMRAMERQLSTKIRRSLPLNRTTESINHFLNQLEEDCREAEEHDSDEFVWLFDVLRYCPNLDISVLTIWRSALLSEFKH